jgi:eukaryotic-like serine/threonine-protein kinase
MSDAQNGYWQQVEEIFHQALDLPKDARAAFLDEHCSGNADLKREVRGILNGYEAQDRLDSANTPELNEGSREGSRYGAFEIVRKIGEGGMGAVYLARRHEDFEQRAAIKLINGTPTAAAMMAERFRQERQILAGLEHPNIARLLDGGVTGDGQPYLVMEYVVGFGWINTVNPSRFRFPSASSYFARFAQPCTSRISTW